MKNKGKMIIILVLMIILIIVTVILTNKLISLMTSKEPDDIMVRIDNTIENHLNNTVQGNNIANAIDENVINNTVENNTVNENNSTVNQNVVNNNTSTGKEQEVDKETIEKEENSQEKAINIAKNDWGEDSNVYFSYEGIDNGKYIVYVRNNTTTRVLRIYTIDVSSGTFTVQ